MTAIIVICVLLIIIVSVVLLIVSKRNDEDTHIEYSNKTNNNQKDLYNMQNLNDNIFVAKKVNSSDIKIPDFDKNKPIGYKDKSNLGSINKQVTKEDEKFKRRTNY